LLSKNVSKHPIYIVYNLPPNRKYFIMLDNYYQDIVSQESNETLLTIVYQFDQWDADMLQAVEIELQNRNILQADISSKKEILIYKEDKILSIGREATFPQQFFGWVGIVGFLGLIIGYDLAFAKNISKYTGKVYFKYNDETRENGRYMYYISLTIIIVFALYKLMNFF
jgi:hypothetical protein